MNKKQQKLWITALSLMTLTAPVVAYANDEINVTINGTSVNFEGQGPVIEAGRTLVPIRGVFEALHFYVDWDGTTQTVSLDRMGDIVTLVIGEADFIANGEVFTLDVPAQIIGGRTLLPIRAVLESVGYDLDWDQASRTVIVSGSVDDDADTEEFVVGEEPRETTQTTDPTINANEVEVRIFELTNIERINHGLTPLQWDDAVADAARDHNIDMLDNDFLSHTGFDGSSVADRLDRRNVGNRTSWAENVASSAGSERLASEDPGANHVERWMNSEGHRANILNPNLTHIGVAFERRIENGQFRDRATQKFITDNGNGSRANTTQTPPTNNNANNNNTSTDREAPFRGTVSSITLPNRRLTDAEREEWIAEYQSLGGASEFELEVLRLVNIERTSRGLNALELDERLMMASRFYAQTLSTQNQGLGHHIGPYGGSASTGVAFGFTTGTARNGIAGRWTPEANVQGWMDSPGHRNNILNPRHTHMGAGFTLGGQWGVFGYQFFGTIAGNQQTTPNQPTAQGINLNLVQQGVSNSDVTLTGGGRQTANTTISISATPNNERVEFVNWEVSNGTATIASPNSLTTNVTLGNNSATIRAVFRRIPHFNVTGNQFTSGDGNGNRISVNGNTGIPARDFVFGEEVTLTAQPAEGFRFVSWNTVNNATIRDVNSETTTLVFDQSHTQANPRQISVSARFEREQVVQVPRFRVDNRTDAAKGTVTLNGGNSWGNEFALGEILEIEAVGNTTTSGHYEFDGWETSGVNATFTDVNNASTTILLDNPNHAGASNVIVINITARWRFVEDEVVGEPEPELEPEEGIGQEEINEIEE